MTLLDLFSGYGGFHKGFTDAGFKFRKTYYSEIDKHAIANYKYNFKDENIEHIGAIETVLESGIERPNVITFGSPCQDFSTIGKRSGIDGRRSGLIFKAIAAIAHFRPDVYVWENVKGVFSSNARADFITILQAFANVRGYRCEWQLLDTAWFLPQHRERVFLVGRLANKCREEIFPFGENDAFCNKKNASPQPQAKTCSTIRRNYGCNPEDTYIVTRPHDYEGQIKGASPTISDKAFANNTYVISYSRTRDGKNISYHPKTIANAVTPPSGNTSQYIYSFGDLRRLTEVECERLQGLPDDWTKYGIYDCATREIPMTHRRHLIGNGVTVKVVSEIAKRILKNTNFISKV